MDPPRFRSILGTCLLLLVALACTAETSSAPDPVVTMVGSWEGPEAAAFEAVVEPFEQRTGLRVEYISTRDPLASLEEQLAAGDPPEIVALPSPAALAHLAREGHLMELERIVDLGTYKRQTAPAFVTLGTIDGRLYGVAYKGAVKGLIWFDPSVYAGRPMPTWAELQHAAALATSRAHDMGLGLVTWCMALESAESSGWSGTDWIEDFLLRQSGPEIYDAWVAGDLPWTSPDVAWAFQSYGLVVDAAGDAGAVVATHFSETARQLLGDPPRCMLLHQGSFMPEFLDAVGGSYDFMPFPDIDPRYAGALIGGGDLLAMTNDTPGARALVRYLASAEAQQILVDQGGAISGNLDVRDYPDDVTRRMARMLADATIFRFDASDSMPPQVEAAFREAVVAFTADPEDLDGILRRVDAVRSRSEGPS